MKLLLYCTKAKPYLVKSIAKPMHTLDTTNPFNFNWKLVNKGFSNDRLNGKIVAECDFEAEEIELLGDEINIYYGIENKACLTTEQIENYLGYDNDYKGYAIHIKNLHIFDKPKGLSEYSFWCAKNISDYYWETISGVDYWREITKAPQNMMYCYEEGEKKVLISIRPEWLCKILNGEKTVEIRKKVLKEISK